MSWCTVVKTIRLPFLLLTPICVGLGVACAYYVGLTVNMLHAVLACIAGLLAHVAVNALNEFEDYESGLDLKTDRTPFSGGSGALPDDSASAGSVRRVALFALLGTVVIGGYFVWQFGLGILLPGMLGILLILTYTRWLNRLPWLCLIAPGIGFGLLMVLGSHLVVSGQYSSVAAVAAAITFLLVNNLLLLNQFPDIEADQTVGRRHLPIVYGVGFSTVIYGAFLVAAIVLVLLSCAQNLLPSWCYLLLVPLASGFYVMVGAVRYGAALASHIHYLALNVMISLMVPLLLAASLILNK